MDPTDDNNYDNPTEDAKAELMEIGRVAGYEAGHTDGHDEGYNEGNEEGYERGFGEGEIAGWNDAIGYIETEASRERK